MILKVNDQLIDAQVLPEFYLESHQKIKKILILKYIEIIPNQLFGLVMMQEEKCMERQMILSSNKLL